MQEDLENRMNKQAEGNKVCESDSDSEQETESSWFNTEEV